MAEEENSKIKKSKRDGKILPGVILVALGMVFLLNNYGLTNVDIGKLWPVFLVIPGIYMILGSLKN